LEARVGEAERLLAQVGKSLPESRISRAPQRSPGGSAAPSSSLPGHSPAGTSAPGSGSAIPPRYIPPSVPSLPGGGSEDASADASEDAVQWRPMRRQ
jgi:hypothetical protein